MKRCQVCWCSEEQSCPGGCSWSAEGPPGFGLICSSCVRTARHLGELLSAATKRPELVGGLGWTVLHYLVVDDDGPRVVLNRWQSILTKSEVPPPPPSYAELYEFLTRGRELTAAIEAQLAALKPAVEAADADVEIVMGEGFAPRMRGKSSDERRRAKGKKRKPRPTLKGGSPGGRIPRGNR